MPDSGRHFLVYVVITPPVDLSFTPPSRNSGQSGTSSTGQSRAASADAIPSGGKVPETKTGLSIGLTVTLEQ